MRYCAPARGAVPAAVFARPPLADFVADYGAWLAAPEWPSIKALQAALAQQGGEWIFALQDRDLLADGLHYESRIAERGVIATRAENWHDLFNALIWLRYPALKKALNRRQVEEIALTGPKQRSRAQCALTHFDEAGALVAVDDPALLTAWDGHDWTALFLAQREAWQEGRIRVEIFGHALLEHALSESGWLVAKALVFQHGARNGRAALAARAAAAVTAGKALLDPQELRPLPLAGMPGWHSQNHRSDFYTEAECFRPLRAGRRYPPPQHFTVS